MSAFLSDDFLLNSETARRLYREHAEPQPIFDYHTHLSAADIAADRRFNNLTEIWLEGDHYKWRAMRASGIPERFCAGDAEPCDKFIAWARVVPNTLRNPLYHWTHLELQRYFGITALLNEKTAPTIWKQANAVLQDGLSVGEILRKFHVNSTLHHGRSGGRSQQSSAYPRGKHRSDSPRSTAKGRCDRRPADLPSRPGAAD